MRITKSLSGENQMQKITLENAIKIAPWREKTDKFGEASCSTVYIHPS